MKRSEMSKQDRVNDLEKALRDTLRQLEGAVYQDGNEVEGFYE